MSLSKKLLTLTAPAALLALSACATGLPTEVSRFQALPAPQGQTFFIRAADPVGYKQPLNDRGLEFSQYADLVRRHLTAQGYVAAPTPQSASFIVELDYGVDRGQQRVVTYPGLHSGFGYGGYGRGFGYGGLYRPYYSRFGYFGRPRSAFYYGWDDPFWGSPFGPGYRDVDVQTFYTSHLDMEIKRASDGQPLFEGTAQARSRTDDLRVLVPNLVEAMFTNFPGRSGETVRITVPNDPRRR
jgi:hypothetical protein